MPAYFAKIKSTGETGAVLHTFEGRDGWEYAVFEPSGNDAFIRLEYVDRLEISPIKLTRGPASPKNTLPLGTVYGDGSGRCYTVRDYTRKLDGEQVYIGYCRTFDSFTATREERVLQRFGNTPAYSGKLVENLVQARHAAEDKE